MNKPDSWREFLFDFWSWLLGRKKIRTYHEPEVQGSKPRLRRRHTELTPEEIASARRYAETLSGESPE